MSITAPRYDDEAPKPCCGVTLEQVIELIDARIAAVLELVEGTGDDNETDVE